MRYIYCLSKEALDLDRETCRLGPYYVYYEVGPGRKAQASGHFAVLVFGDVWDIQEKTDDLKQLAQKLSREEHLEGVLARLATWSGRYLVFLYRQGELWTLPDPINSIPCYYIPGEAKHLTSSQRDSAVLAYEPENTEALAIKKAAESQQPLPYNLTFYRHLKFLLGNEMLKWPEGEARRIYPRQPLVALSGEEVIEKTMAALLPRLQAAAKVRDLALPLTAGVDSRLVLALMKKAGLKPPAYTFKHQMNLHADVRVARELSVRFAFPYQILERQGLPQNTMRALRESMGPLYNERIAENSYTFSQSDLSARRPVPGDIVPLLKSNFGRDFPEERATVSYLKTKLHNYHPKVDQYLAAWLRDIKPYTEQTGYSIFDLCFWEQRLGRWLSNNINHYDWFEDRLMIFNCRYLMDLWIRIPRPQRIKTDWEVAMIDALAPELLSIPINPHEKWQDRLFANSTLYYWGTYLKYYLQSLRYR